MLTVSQAITNINDTLRGEPTPVTASKPFNSQGQHISYPATIPTTTSTQQFNPFNLPPPPVATPLPTVDLSTLPPPPLPLAPLRFSGEVPPPPIANGGGVGALKKPPGPDTGTRPSAPPLKAMPGTLKTQPAKPTAKVAAKPPQFIPPTQEMLQERLGQPAPVRVLPAVGQAKQSNLNSTANASEEESRAFVEYINTSTLQQDPDVKGILPIKANSSDIYTIVSDGWLLWYQSFSFFC